MNRLPEGLDATRTPLAASLHTGRLALAAVAAAGACCLIFLAACLLP